MSEQLPSGCLPFDVSLIQAGARATRSAGPAEYIKSQSDGVRDVHQFNGDGKWWWVNDDGKCVSIPAGEQHPWDWHVYMSKHQTDPKFQDLGRISDLPKAVLNPDVKIELAAPQYVSFAGQPKPTDATQACYILLDQGGQRKFSITAPLSVTKAELVRIQAWIALQLLVEGE